MQLHVSPEINEVMEKALGLSVQQGQFYVGVEHVLAALLEDPDRLPQGFREQYLNALYTVMREVARTVWNTPVATPSGEVFHTPRCINLINQAGKFAEISRRGPAQAGHLLLAVLVDNLSAPSRAMDTLELGRAACVAALREELNRGSGAHRKGASAPAVSPNRESNSARPANGNHEDGRVRTGLTEADASRSGETDHGPESRTGAASLTRSLTEAAERGELAAAIGREHELFEILQVLTRKTKNNVMLVGEAGVGKTQVVEGLARMLVRKNGVGAPNFRILELNLAALLAGTQYRGAFEEKLLGLLEELKRSEDTVLFIDEVHLIMGAGATDGDAMDLSNLLKPALSRGEIRCIGATTLQEYRKFVERDPAIERRFQMVRIEELPEEATLLVLQQLRPSLEKHHGVKISGRAIQEAVRLTQRYLPNRRQPDKSIDTLDQACARYCLKLMAIRRQHGDMHNTLLPTADHKVTPHDIRKVVSQISGVPLEEITTDERMNLNDLERRLRMELIGQDEAVSKVVSAVKKSRVGLADPNRPVAVMLFLGPTGVGKTQLAKSLATHVFGSRNHLFTFDMSEYVEEHSVSRLLGPPPGYVGSEEGGRLASVVHSAPFSILLFDEIEKAHPRVFDIFLPIFDEGRIKDSRGRDVSFRNCIIILTSNVGCDQLSRSDPGNEEVALIEELRQYFRPEFINRIDEIVPFYSLLAEDIRSILRLEINRVRERLRDRKIGIRMYQRAYEYLATQGYNADFGARELRRVVDRLVTTPISEMLVDGAFQRGDMIDVLMDDEGALVFRKGRAHHEMRERS